MSYAAAAAATGCNGLQGRIKKWDTEKGFGFIVPDSGGGDVFVHRNAFSGGPHRGGDLLIGAIVHFAPPDDSGGPELAALLPRDACWESGTSVDLFRYAPLDAGMGGEPGDIHADIGLVTLLPLGGPARGFAAGLEVYDASVRGWARATRDGRKAREMSVASCITSAASAV
eukprot:gene46707-12809_t